MNHDFSWFFVKNADPTRQFPIEKTTSAATLDLSAQKPVKGAENFGLGGRLCAALRGKIQTGQLDNIPCMSKPPKAAPAPEMNKAPFSTAPVSEMHKAPTVASVDNKRALLESLEHKSPSERGSSDSESDSGASESDSSSGTGQSSEDKSDSDEEISKDSPYLSQISFAAQYICRADLRSRRISPTWEHFLGPRVPLWFDRIYSISFEPSL